MQRYKGVSHGAGVAGFDVGEDFIRLRFLDGSVYRYTYDSTGADAVEAMKQLAQQGDGLTTFINQHVRGAYEKREH